MSQYCSLVQQLRSLLGILEINKVSPLYQDTIAICDYLENSRYRIAVFAPFNHGKSTLLNALLGSKILPMDLIPTTAAGICVGYGEELYTLISLQDGTKIQQQGIEILKQYAILDDKRRMKPEVAEVRIFCHHLLLKTGIEFLDLPGTNDLQAQNDLVQNKLLGADLVIQVLDARKLMTLEERQHLRDWLEDRGVTTIIFVVNFLNLLTLEEQQEVKNRLYFVAESFRFSLPPGIRNIYCVDALPALRARLTGNLAEAKTTGITSLESALQSIASLNQQQQNKLYRGIKIAKKLLNQAVFKRQEIQQEIVRQQDQVAQQIQIKQKAQKLIQQSLARKILDFQVWLYLPRLLANYQPSLAISLQQTRFDQWLESTFKADVLKHQRAVNKLILQGCDFFQYHNPQLLSIDLTFLPVIKIPQDNITNQSYFPQELNFLLQKKAGAVVLGGASYIINKLNTKSLSTNNNLKKPNTRISSKIYVDAAEVYLKEFSDRSFQALNQYEQISSQYITYTPATNKQQIAINYQLKLIDNLTNDIVAEINKLSH
jgi:GTPase SAR1 family protein